MIPYPLPSIPTHFQPILIENLTNLVGIDSKSKSKVGGKLNREIVSVRSCVRTRGLVVRWELEKIELAPVSFPFSLLAQDGISFEFCVVLVNPGEI